MIKAAAFDVLVVLGLMFIQPVMGGILSVVAGDNPFVGLLTTLVLFFALCGFAGWWFANLAMYSFRSFGYRRYNLHRVYGDTGNPVGLGGALLRLILSPIDLTLLLLKVNVANLLFWARNVQVIYVPPGQPLPKGPLPRRNSFPAELNEEYKQE